MLESQTLRIGTVASIILVVIGAVVGFYAWAEDKHKNLEAVARESAKLAQETQTNNKLLTQIQAQQNSLVIRATENSEKNRETLQKTREALIRIEAKLESSD